MAIGDDVYGVWVPCLGYPNASDAVCLSCAGSSTDYIRCSSPPEAWKCERCSRRLAEVKAERDTAALAPLVAPLIKAALREEYARILKVLGTTYLGEDFDELERMLKRDFSARYPEEKKEEDKG